VHQDGLVHISALSHEFVKDPREVVKAGDIVKVKVMDVDIPRKRIALSMRLDDKPGESNRGERRSSGAGNGQNERRARGGDRRGGNPSPQPQGAMAGALAEALAAARKGKR